MSINVNVATRRSAALSAPDWATLATVWADEVGPLVRDAIRREAPVGSGPGAGRLRNSIGMERVTAEGLVTLTFTATVPYAGYVVDGTSPHIIEPHTARVLAWQGPAGVMFARRVNHPGTQPNRFAQRAVEALMPLLRQRLQQITQSALEE